MTSDDSSEYQDRLRLFKYAARNKGLRFVVGRSGGTLHAANEQGQVCGLRVKDPHEPSEKEWRQIRCGLHDSGRWIYICSSCEKRLLSDDSLAWATRDWRPNKPNPIVEHKPQGGGSMQHYVRFYQDGDAVAVSTNVLDEAGFNRFAPSALAEFLASGSGSSAELLNAALPLIVDLSCKLRGYKAPLVEEQRLLTAGRIPPRDSLLVASSEEKQDAANASV